MGNKGEKVKWALHYEPHGDQSPRINQVGVVAVLVRSIVRNIKRHITRP